MIDFTLSKVGPTKVVFSILEMDEDQRNVNDVSGFYLYPATNNFAVISAFTPGLYHNAIYLLGTNHKHEVETRVYDIELKTEGLRDVYYDKVLEALKEWAEVGGFPNREVSTLKKEPKKYETEQGVFKF